MASPDQVEAARVALGRVSVTGEVGTSTRLPPFASIQQTGSSYARVVADFQDAGYAGRIAVGDLSEPFGPLGSTLTGAFASPAQTRFMTVGGARTLGSATFYGEASLGRTAFSSTLLKTTSALDSSWRAGVVDAGPCVGFWRLCSSVGFELDQPLRFEGGDAVAVLANVPANYFDPWTFSERRIGLAPSGRELDLRLFADRELGTYGSIRLEATAASQEGNVAGAAPGLGFLATWRVGF